MEKAISLYQNLPELLRNCVVKITAQQLVGTGFFVAPGKIITCAHVIEESPRQNIAIHWRNRIYTPEILYLRSSPYPDLALLQIHIGEDEHHCVLLHEEVEIGDQLYAYGFPVDQEHGDSALFIFEGPTGGTNRLLKLKNAQASPGLSGAPLLNIRTGLVCGIIKKSRDIYSDLGGRALPTSVAFSAIPELKHFQEIYHRQDKVWLQLQTNPGKYSQSALDFKLKTRIALEAIGYKTQENVFLAGQIIDIYAEATNPLYIHRMIVDCQNEEKEVDLVSISKFSSVIDTISTKSKPVSGMIVSHVGFFHDSIKFAKRANIKLVTLDELLAQSFDPSKIIEHIIDSYDQDELQKVYIELSCQVSETTPGTIYKPVEKFLDSFFSNTTRLGVAVLGNFGSGKTSLCKHYSYLLARKWSDHKSNAFLPIYVSLRDLENFNNLLVDILLILQSAYQARITESGWNYWLQHGLTLLFLDGFDEMASKMDKPQISKTLENLKRFTSKTKVKVILTCRTHFFKSQVDESALRDMVRLYIRDWGTDELEEYVAKSLPDKNRESLRVIRSTYNLEELAKTPIFLSMITDTIEQIGGVVNQSKLYQVYTDRWIQNQDYRSNLSPIDKQLFMEELALEMYVTDKIRIENSFLPTKIKETFSIREYEELKAFDSDIRTCSFLIRDPEGRYYFAHKSFMEYFTAFRLAKEVKSKLYENISRKSLSIEVANFFSNYFEGEAEVLIRGLMGNPNPIARSNFALSLGCLELNATILNALSLAIEMDSSVLVKQTSIDALTLRNNEIAVDRLIRFATADNDLAIYCIRKLTPFGKNEKIISFLRGVLRASTVSEKISASIDVVYKAAVLELLDDLHNFIHLLKWRGNYKVIESLITAINEITDLSLALELWTIEKNVVEGDLLAYIQNVKMNLKQKFSSQVERDAKDNKSNGANYRSNQKMIRQKYSYLIDDSHLLSLFSQLYPPQKVKNKPNRKNRRK